MHHVHKSPFRKLPKRRPPHQKHSELVLRAELHVVEEQLHKRADRLQETGDKNAIAITSIWKALVQTTAALEATATRLNLTVGAVTLVISEAETAQCPPQKAESDTPTRRG